MKITILNECSAKVLVRQEGRFKAKCVESATHKYAWSEISESLPYSLCSTDCLWFTVCRRRERPFISQLAVLCVDSCYSHSFFKTPLKYQLWFLIPKETGFTEGRPNQKTTPQSGKASCRHECFLCVFSAQLDPWSRRYRSIYRSYWTVLGKQCSNHCSVCVPWIYVNLCRCWSLWKIESIL